jgi:hypothetical protein
MRSFSFSLTLAMFNGSHISNAIPQQHEREIRAVISTPRCASIPFRSSKGADGFSILNLRFFSCGA